MTRFDRFEMWHVLRFRELRSKRRSAKIGPISVDLSAPQTPEFIQETERRWKQFMGSLPNDTIEVTGTFD